MIYRVLDWPCGSWNLIKKYFCYLLNIYRAEVKTGVSKTPRSPLNLGVLNCLPQFEMGLSHMILHRGLRWCHEVTFGPGTLIDMGGAWCVTDEGVGAVASSGAWLELKQTGKREEGKVRVALTLYPWEQRIICLTHGGKRLYEPSEAQMYCTGSFYVQWLDVCFKAVHKHTSYAMQ